MNVLHVLDHSRPVQSGYSVRSHSIVRAQRARGLRPVALTSSKHLGATRPREDHDGIPYYRTPPLPRAVSAVPFAREVALMARLAARIVAVARAEQIDVIHAHSPLLNGFPAVWAGRRLGRPVVYEARAFWEDAAVDHGTVQEGALRYRLTRALETRLFRQAARVVVICEGMRHDLIGRGIPAERIIVVGNGVETAWLEAAPRDETLARALGLDGGPVFGFIGSFYRYEGLRFLMATIERLRRAMPAAKLLLVGGGEDEPLVRTTAVRLGDAVVYAGRAPHERVQTFYGLIDVFVCPRRAIRLTELVTPLKPIEAMAMAIPVLASDIGGHRELIRHERTGLLFPPESHERFVAEASRVGCDGEFRQRLGSAAREWVARERTWDRLVSRYEDLYAAVG